MARDVLHGRRCVVVVDETRFDNLHVAFKVDKTADKKPNTADIAITNLSRASMAAMRKKSAKVTLFAGYAETVAQVFQGDARTIDHVHSATEWVTKISAGDGESAYVFARASESFAPGAKVADVVRYLANAMGVDASGAVKKFSALPPGRLSEFANGYAVHGKASAALDQVLRAVGLRWSIQDGKLQILGPTETIVGEEAVVLAPETGLVGSPEHGSSEKEKGPPILKVKSLLQPRIRPGGKVEVRSFGAQGLYRVERVTHSGETSGGPWYSELEVVAT